MLGKQQDTAHFLQCALDLCSLDIKCNKWDYSPAITGLCFFYPMVSSLHNL